MLAPFAKAFQPTGGLKVLSGNLGKAIIKTSAVKPERRFIEAPALVFDSQQALNDAFKAGALDRDFVAVVRFQGPKANGMPELHKLTTVLGVLQDRGQQVALVTDGRMSGASGKVPAAIHLTPEALEGGAIGKVRDGDLIRLDAENGTIEVIVRRRRSRSARCRRSTSPAMNMALGASCLPASGRWWPRRTWRGGVREGVRDKAPRLQSKGRYCKHAP